MGGSPDEAPTACTPEGMGAGAGSGFGGATGLAGAAATDSGARASGSDEAACAFLSDTCAVLRPAGLKASMRSSVIVKPAYSSGASERSFRP